MGIGMDLHPMGARSHLCGLLFATGGVAGDFLGWDWHIAMRLAGRAGQAVWENLPLPGAALPGTVGVSHQDHVRHLWKVFLLWSGSESAMASFFCEQGRREFSGNMDREYLQGPGATGQG